MTFAGPLDPDLPSWAFDLRGTLPAPRATRDADKIKRMTHHRLGGPDWPDTAEELIEVLGDAWLEATGERCCPYWGVIEPSGRLVVVHDLHHKGQHAGKYNPKSLALGWIGDFRRHAPTAAQRETGLRTAQWACDRFERGVDFHTGHDELDGGSAHASKRCPGPLLDMDAFREDLAAGRGIVSTAD